MTLSFENLMIFIGQNNHWKSNTLSAILFFFGKLNHSDLDFFCQETNLFVEILFTELDENDKKTFDKYIDKDWNIRVQKIATKWDSPKYHWYCEIPQDEFLQEEKASLFTSRDSVNVTPLKSNVPPTGRITKDIIIDAQKKYIEEHKSSITFQYKLEEGSFLWFTSVASWIFWDVFFVPAVRSASDELESKGKGLFAQLLEKVINQMSEKNDKYKDAKSQINKLVNNLNKLDESGNENIERPEELSNLESKMTEELKNRWTKIDIEITPPKIDDFFKVWTNVRVDDWFRTDISRKWHGLQRALIFALIKSRVTLMTEENTGSWESNTNRQKSNSQFFIFEEPELYLHPQAQREFFDSLRELSELWNQVILTTHSSSFVNIENYKSISIIRKDRIETWTYSLQYIQDIFDDIDEKQSFNMAYYINPDRWELFFSKKIILVEWQTDKTIIPNLARKINCFNYSYSIIDCASKDNIKLYVKLLNKFWLNYVCVYDKDHQLWKTQDGKNNANKSSKNIEDVIDASIWSSVVFENDIEEEIWILDEKGKNKPYEALKKISETDFTITPQLLDKIKKIYQ